jgi:predicted nucleic acid-binding protein
VRRVLVDTGALVALVRARDKHHALVAQFFGEFLSGDLVTTLPVLTEAMHLRRDSHHRPRLRNLSHAHARAAAACISALNALLPASVAGMGALMANSAKAPLPGQ